MKLFLTLLVIAYVLLPYDILPDFIVGLGWLDDIGLLSALWYYLYSSRHRSRSSGTDRQKDPQDVGSEKPASSREAVPHESNDPYTVLGIDKGASKEEIRKRYRELAGQYHPDKVAHLGSEFQQLAEKKFKAVQWAYQRLTE
jgi:hypothetical protein